jgi:hypothetical protein
VVGLSSVSERSRRESDDSTSVGKFDSLVAAALNLGELHEHPSARRSPSVIRSTTGNRPRAVGISYTNAFEQV